MITQIIDNFFDEKFLLEFFETVENLQYSANNIANKKTWPYGSIGTHKLLGCNIFKRHDVNRILNLHNKSEVFFNVFDALQTYLQKSFYLSSIDINCQHSGCDGTFHRDSASGTITMMMFPNPKWEKEWGGEFEIFSEETNKVIEIYDYIPGRILIFPSNVLHRGLGPKKEYVYRYSVVFRLSEIEMID